MKKIRVPEHATISVSAEDWGNRGGYSGWAWFIAIVIFLLIGWGSTDGDATPDTVNPNPSVSATHAP